MVTFNSPKDCKNPVKSVPLLQHYGEYIQLATYFLDQYFQKLVLQNKSYHLCLQGLAGYQFNSSQKA